MQKNQLSKIKLITLLFGVFSIVFVFIALITTKKEAPNTPSQPEKPTKQITIPSYQTITVSQNSRFILTGVQSIIPQQMNVYRLKTSFDLTPVTNEIVKTYSLNPTQNPCCYQSTEYYLSTTQNSLTLTKTNHQTPPGTFEPNTTLNKATDLFSSLKLPNINNYKIITHYLGGGNEPVQTDKDHAKYIKLTLIPTIDSYPIIYSNSQTSENWLYYNSHNELIKLFVQDTIPTFETINTVKTNNLSQIIANLELGNLSLINATTNTNPTITSFTTKSATIEYRQNSTSDLILPYLRLQGNATVNNQTSQLDIITPLTDQ